MTFVFLLGTTVAAKGEQVPWEQVKDKLTHNSGYSLRCDYTGPEGVFYFNYVVHGAGDQILTEVLEGSSRGVGTRIYYNPELDSENVTMQTRLFRLRRSLQARDIKDSPLYKPLFVHLLNEICEPEPRASEDKERSVVFLFGDVDSTHEYLEVDREGNPLTLRRMEAGKQLNLLTFHQLEWGPQPLNWEK